MQDRFSQAFRPLLQAYTTLYRAFTRREYHCSFAESATLVAIDAVSLIVLVRHYQAGAIDLATIVMLLTVVTLFSETLQLLGQQLAYVKHETLYVGDTFNFLDAALTVRGGSATISRPGPLEVCFENVSFHYPGSDELVLENLNLTLEAGSSYALVGVNGAGKTTLVKLLTGLYQPTSGRIWVNGSDATSIPQQELFELFGVVFQEVQPLALTVAENVAGADEAIDRERVVRCLQTVGLWDKIQSYPQGIDSPMLKVIHDDGIILSGGENQKLAMARCLYRSDTRMLILDEPTSALDALAEERIYREFEQILSGRTALFISHRLASTRFCDHIVLLDGGRITQQGTHDSLMQEEGRGAGDTSGAVRFTLIIASFLLARYLLLQLTALLKRHEQIHQARLERSFPIAFAEKVMRIDYANLEDPEILDLKERALFPVTNYGALSGLFMSLIRVVTAVFTLAGVTLMLLQFSVLFTLVILVLSLVGLVFNARFMARFKEIADSIIPVNRRYSYYADTATRPDAQKEYRLYNMSGMMNRKISGYTQEINDWLRNIYLTQGDTESGQAVMSAISSFLTYVYVALRVLTDRFGPQIGLAEFSVIVLATQSFARSFREAYVSLYQVIQNIGFLEPFAQFIDLPETAAQLGELQDPGRFETLSFERVSFTYPGTDRVILEEVSFDLHAGETISIVGLNNAGKSTLVKLICRLFEPSSGRILWNGTDIRDNIAAGDTEPTDETVWEVLDRVSIGGYIRDLPRQLDTHLDKALYEDATDLSGGQKQKLAIARAVYKQAELVILGVLRSHPALAGWSSSSLRQPPQADAEYQSLSRTLRDASRELSLGMAKWSISEASLVY